MNKDFKNYEILIITIILAFCSIVYELLLSSTLAVVTGKPVWWQSMTIGFYIGGLGIGAFRAESKLDHYRELFNTELILSLLGCLCVVIVYITHGAFMMTDYLNYLGSDYHSSLYIQNNFYIKGAFFIIVQSLTFVIGMYSGQEIPLLIDIYQKNHKGEHSNKILGLNYLGTLLGTVVFAFFFFPKLDVLYTSLVVASLNLFICFYLLGRKYLKINSIQTVSMVVISLLILSIFIKIPQIERNYLKVAHLFKRTIHDYKLNPFLFYQNLDKMNDIERHKSLYQYIDIFDVQEKGSVVERIVALDSKFQYSTFNEALYHDAFAHIPLGLAGKRPRRILVLGGGDGLLIRELLKYPEVEEIIQVELDEKIVEMHKNEKRFTDLNENSLNNKRVKTIIGDAFYFLRNNTEKFETILIDFPYPNNYNLAKLFSIEFYTFVNRSLSENGIAVIDAPVVAKERYNKALHFRRPVLDYTFTNEDKNYNSVLLSTLYYAGFEKLYPYKVGGESFIMFGKKNFKLNYHFLEQEHQIFRRVSSKELARLKSQEFPYKLDRKYVNSIFRPRLVSTHRFWRMRSY